MMTQTNDHSLSNLDTAECNLHELTKGAPQRQSIKKSLILFKSI